MVQEEIRDKSVAFVIHAGRHGGKLTAGLLKQAVRQYQKQAREPQHGKQSIKSLVGQGAGVQNIEVTDKNIRSFERTARKYGVDYAVKKDASSGKYFVFFKARDADALNAAFADYTAETLKRQKRKPSVRKQLAGLKQEVQEPGVQKEKRQEKGGMEL